MLSWAGWPKSLYSTFSSSKTQRHTWQGPMPRWGALGCGFFSWQNFLERWCPNHPPTNPAPRTSVGCVPGASWSSRHTQHPSSRPLCSALLHSLTQGQAVEGTGEFVHTLSLLTSSWPVRLPVYSLFSQPGPRLEEKRLGLFLPSGAQRPV